MARTGRPRKKIDINQFEKLCGLQCTEEEIAAFFDCSVDTINNFCIREYKATFSEVFNKKRKIGKISLRRNQWKLSEKSPAMAIFLGKQYLGQTDDLSGVINLKEDEKDALSVAFEEFTENGLTGDDK